MVDSPPVPLQNQCSIIHNNTLYVYSPDAFQTLPLQEGGKWSQETNGVSVTGAECVYGGIDGDNNRSALYVVGGVANSSNSGYPGLQRYDLVGKSWTTITPLVPITQHRQYHGAAYMNASSGLVVYGGSQNGQTGASSETFFMEMYPPYRVQAYSSTAPPTVKPFILPWNQDRTLLVGGSPTNQKIFTFGPANGWQDLGLALPLPLPDSSVGQAALFDLDDGSRILQTFNLGSTPVSIMTNVLLNPGGQPAEWAEVVGGSITTAGVPVATGAATMKRATFLNTYPTYNGANMPNSTRNGFSIAQGHNGLVAFVGGDENSTVSFFDQSANGWVLPEKILGNQQPIVTPTTSSVSVTPTSTRSTPTATATTSPTPISTGDGKSHGLTILGAVLGGICGVAAILIILLLWMRNVRRRRQREDAKSRKSYPRGKRASSDYDFEEGLAPLSKNGQAMGRSPVPSTVISEAGTTAMFAPRPSEKNLIRRVSNDGKKGPPEAQKTNGQTFAQGLFQRERSPLSVSISKPMNPNLGDYNLRDRPSIDLGRATPAAPVNSTALIAASATAAAAGTVPSRNKSQRKTDEAWAKYFNGADVDPTTAYKKSHSPANSRNGGGFWPGSGVPEPSTKSPRLPLRDSAGNLLSSGIVATASPTMEHGPRNMHTRNLSTAQGMSGKMSSANSISSDDSDYDDEHVLSAAFSSGVPHTMDSPWTPVGNTWSGPAQRPVRPSMEAIGANDFPPPTAGTGSSGNTSDTKSSGIPNFPMPRSSIRPVRASGGGESGLPGTVGISQIQHPASAYTTSTRHQPREPSGYFSGGSQSTAQNTDDMSWLNLGTPKPPPAPTLDD